MVVGACVVWQAAGEILKSGEPCFMLVAAEGRSVLLFVVQLINCRIEDDSLLSRILMGIEHSRSTDWHNRCTTNRFRRPKRLRIPLR